MRHQHGPIHRAISTFYKYVDQPNTNQNDHVVMDGIHAIDTLRWMCGGEVASIHCIAKSVGMPDVNVHTAIMEFDTGAVGVLLTDFISGRRIFKVEMHSLGACAEVELEYRGSMFVKQTAFAHKDIKADEYDTTAVAGSSDARVIGGFEAINRSFIDAVKNGTQTPTNLADSVKTMEIVEKIRIAAMK